MAETRVERRLAAILAADVAAYSRLMGADEEGTLAQLKAHRRDLVDPKINEHRGRIVKTTGDGMLVEFASAVDAVRCAVAVQRGMAALNSEVAEDRRIEFRVGVNVGDIIIDGGDIFGDGVNVAARLESLAEPGGICVSGRVQEDTRGKVDIAFEDLGEQQLKNIAWPVRVCRVRLSSTPRTTRPVMALPDKPSIAVLPFQNMSGDPDQEYFCDGMVEDIITALSRIRWLFVIARNSSFIYKDRIVDVKQIGRELGVRYVLEGSVRKAGPRLRITGQLIDASSGSHLWADRFDGSLEDVFDLQDRVTASVVGAIAPKLEQVEVVRAKQKATENLDAYDYFLRALACIHRDSRERTDEALRLLNKAIELDPEFSSAYGLAAFCHAQRKAHRWVTNPAQEIDEAARLARLAAEFGRDNAAALCWGGYARAYVALDLDGGNAMINRALVLNPNLAAAWYFSGWVNVYLGEPDVAIDRLEQAKRLNPLDPLIVRVQTAMAAAYIFAGRYDDASRAAEIALQEQPNFHPALRMAAVGYALAGRLGDARKTMAHLRELDPALRVSDLRELTPLRRSEDIAKYEEGLRKAGLPE